MFNDIPVQFDKFESSYYMAYSLNSNYLWRIEFMNERKLHYLLLVAFSLSNKMIIEQTNREKLMPGQPKILEFLLGHDGCTQKEIAKACILDKSTVTSLITRMLLCGLVRKDSDLPDRRTNCIYLTEEGRNMAERVREICDVVDDTGWRGISKEERDDFCRIFEKIIQNLEEGEEKSYGTKTS